MVRAVGIMTLMVLASVALADGDAAGTDHWAYQPLSKAAPPADASWSEHPIDRFIFARMNAAGVKPNSPADRRTLIRRAYFDLIGLPPKPEEVEAFVQDQSPDAFGKLIDRLLASPRYGERWGRHWLDLARYADTSGDAADAPVPEAYLYRNYVIDSFNADLPYDQFIVEQIAGDILAKQEPSERDRTRMIATGFVALSRRFGNTEYGDFHLVIDNTLDTIGRSMLAVTLSCARCHDHKFDPISQEDYYGLYGYFSSTLYPHPSTEHSQKRKNFINLPPDSEALAKWEQRQSELKKQIEAEKDETKRKELAETLKKHEANKPKGDLAYAVIDKEKVGDARLLRQGNPRLRGDRVKRGFIEAFTNAEPTIPEGRSGRLELAKWIASPDNPLTPRVMANRIWQYHLGTGLVRTSSTFGLQGETPSHPALLDYLARTFIERGWSIKAMHRLIMTSKTYQLDSSATHAGNREKDSTNRLLWHYPARRLEAEAIRDAVLAVSDRLNLERPGPHPFPRPKDGVYKFTQHHPFLKDYNHEHRSVYLPSRRLGRHPFMEMFNGPDPNDSTARRSVSTVPLQSLFWMNSDFAVTSAQALAGRIIAAAPKQADRIRFAYQLAYSRPPSQDELDTALAYLDQAAKVAGGDSDEAMHKAWSTLAQVLLASNEFVYLR